MVYGAMAALALCARAGRYTRRWFKKKAGSNISIFGDGHNN
jgi:nitrogenase molybdenum-iron protein alpha/beta subunit